ncbi:MAG: cation diffusion facilitator family transporter [Bacteroidia bacterium]|nr:cation diffusion facilitator family transporter [Bacteroidia bacterium]
MTKSKEEIAIGSAYFSILGNLLLAILKWITGYLGNSYALIADAIESTSDVFSSILILLGLRYANRPADENHPYGHGRAEPLFAFLIVGFIAISAFIIAYQSVQNILHPDEGPHWYTLVVLGGIILWKELSFQYVLHKSKQTNSTALLADAWHHRSDAITSIMAFTGISIAIVFGKGFEVADDWAALFSSGIILYNGYRILRPALGEIMDEQLDSELIEQIRTISITVEGVQDTEKCYVRKVGMKYHVDLHACVDGNLSVRTGHEIAHRLQAKLYHELPSLEHVLVHIEPVDH